jgi:hypothetical protein
MQVQIKLLSGKVLTVDVLPIGNREINGLSVLISVAESLQISFFLLSLFIGEEREEREERDKILEPDSKVNDGDIFYAFIRDESSDINDYPKYLHSLLRQQEQWEEEHDLPQELE